MSVRIFPYRTMTGTISLQLSNGLLDGADWPRTPYVPDRQLVHLHDVDKESWEEAEFEVDVTLPSEELSRFDDDGEVNVLLTVECSRTLYREVVRLSRSESETNRWSGTLITAKQNFRGAATVTAIVAGKALDRDDRFVGRSTEWTIQIDEPEIRPMTGTMKVRWMDFEKPEEGLGFLKEYKDHEFFTDMQSEVPTLYLNKSEAFDGLPALLDDRRRRKDERPLHDAERISVARSVWMGLINTAIASIRRDEEGTPDWPMETWKRLVLKRFLHRVYPMHGDDELLKEVDQAWKSTERSADLESKLQLAVEDVIGAGKLLRRTLKILKDSSQAT